MVVGAVVLMHDYEIEKMEEAARSAGTGFQEWARRVLVESAGCGDDADGELIRWTSDEIDVALSGSLS